MTGMKHFLKSTSEPRGLYAEISGTSHCLFFALETTSQGLALGQADDIVVGVNLVNSPVEPRPQEQDTILDNMKAAGVLGHSCRDR